MRALVRDLAVALQEMVRPLLGARAGRAHDRTGASGDVTFALDTAAEQRLGQWVRDHAPGVAYYSEDQGLVLPPGAAPELVLVVDPIDGTRPALAGLESACVSVAVARYGEGSPRMRDLLAGAVVEIKTGEAVHAERGGGVQTPQSAGLSENEDLDRLLWAYNLTGRPVAPTVAVIGELIDRSSIGGGSFDLGASAYHLTRVVTGQLDAFVDPGPRLVEEVPGMREAWMRVGGGQVINSSPYDVAAAIVCLAEAGAVVTDASGRPLDDRPLLGSGPDFHVSVVAAATPVVHAGLLAAIDRGMERLRTSGYGARFDR